MEDNQFVTNPSQWVGLYSEGIDNWFCFFFVAQWNLLHLALTNTTLACPLQKIALQWAPTLVASTNGRILTMK